MSNLLNLFIDEKAKKCCKIFDMDEKIINLAFALKDEISKDPLILKLNNIEKDMENNEEVIALAYQKDIVETNYSDILKIYNESSNEAQSCYKKLLEKKNNLENHPIVKEYYRLFREVRAFYQDLNDLLFKDIIGKRF